MLGKFLFKTLSFLGCLIIITFFTWLTMSAIEIWVHNKLISIGMDYTYNALNFFALVFGW